MTVYTAYVSGNAESVNLGDRRPMPMITEPKVPKKPALPPERDPRKPLPPERDPRKPLPNTPPAKPILTEEK